MSSWPPPPPNVPEIDLAQLESGQTNGVPIIDVREPDEYTTAHVPGARLIPLGDVVARLDEVSREGPVYVICQTGPRSARATEFYRARGIDAYNVSGGTKAWVESGRPVVQGPQPE